MIQPFLSDSGRGLTSKNSPANPEMTMNESVYIIYSV